MNFLIIVKMFDLLLGAIEVKAKLKLKIEKKIE